MYATTPSIARPMFMVFVSTTGTSSAPCVSIQMLPVISPVPFSTQVAAGTFSRHRSPPCGRIAVTPVRTGPNPGRSFPSPRFRVTCPTRTPFTSVMALSGPGAIRPMTIPRSRMRLRAASSPAARAAPAQPRRHPAMTIPPKRIPGATAHLFLMVKRVASYRSPVRVKSAGDRSLRRGPARTLATPAGGKAVYNPPTSHGTERPVRAGRLT